MENNVGAGTFKPHAFLIKYAEIGIKGKNRYVFEDRLVQCIKDSLEKVEGTFSVYKEMGRVYVSASDDYEYDDTVEALKKVFGIAGICPLVRFPDQGFEDLKAKVIAFIKEKYPDQSFTFKVEVRRVDKKYPVRSMDAAALIGEALLEAFPKLKVDVHKPEVLVNIEIREEINVYTEVIEGPGGMPVGSNGKAMLLLSGGIDSPVAGWMISKRGVRIEAVYFHAPPFTSERAKQKVIDLARIVSKWAGPIRLHVVNFTKLQTYIYETCPHEELTIIMRRYMMRIAQLIAAEEKCLALVTGESIGQVASQTMQSLAATNEVCEIPVFRPLIAFDKKDIVDVAQSIGTFETSILPYEDCCTIFVAKHPVTKPNINIIRRSESRLEKAEEMVAECMETKEIIEI
jgi:thiamine biosynthesis protein ThiI